MTNDPLLSKLSAAAHLLKVARGGEGRGRGKGRGMGGARDYRDTRNSRLAE